MKTINWSMVALKVMASSMPFLVLATAAEIKREIQVLEQEIEVRTKKVQVLRNKLQNEICHHDHLEHQPPEVLGSSPMGIECAECGKVWGWPGLAYPKSDPRWVEYLKMERRIDD